MNKEEIKVVVRVLKDHINDNEELLNNGTDLSKTDQESIQAESSACCKAITFLETIENYLKKWSQQLKISGVNSKSMVRNDIQYLLKEIQEEKKEGKN